MVSPEDKKKGQDEYHFQKVILILQIPIIVQDLSCW